VTARIGKQIGFGTGSAIPLLIDGKPIVCESTATLDHSVPAAEARAKGQALIAAADQADQMTTDTDRP
jgi:hypothetical protein